MHAAEAVEGEEKAEDGEKAEDEAPAKKTNNSQILRWFITAIIILSILFCLYRLIKDYWSRNHRDKIDIASALGLALAYISNEEDRNPSYIIKHGVGTDEDNIK